MVIDVSADDSLFIGRAIEGVWHTLGEAAVLVVLVIFLFLGSWRATLIPAVTVPICLLGSMAVLWLCGFSINLLTLLALVLAIGWWSTMRSSCSRTSITASRKASRRSSPRSAARARSASR